MSFLIKFFEWVMEKVTWIKALLFLIATLIINRIMLLVIVPRIEKNTNMSILDMEAFGYSHKYVISFLNAIGKEGRGIYLKNEIPLDFIFPALVGITSVFLVTLLARKISPSLRIFMILPILAALFDYLENVMISILLISYPNVSVATVKLASIFTIVKFDLYTVSLVVLLTMFVIFFYKKIRKTAIK